MRSRRAGSFHESFNVWPGFTDIIVGLLLVFVFVVTLFTMTQTILSRVLTTKDVELQRLHGEISAKSQELERLSLEISKLEQLFQAQVDSATKLHEQLASRGKELELALAEIKANTELLAAKDERLTHQKKEVESALEGIKEKTTLLQDREQRIWEMGLKLSDKDQDLTKTKAELSDKEKSLLDLRARLEMLNSRVAGLNEKIAGYVAEVSRLNQLLAESQDSKTTEKTKAAALQKEIVSLQSKLEEISSKLAGTEAEAEKKFRLSQLVDLLGQKDQEIDRLRKLARYRSEFLAKLEEVFAGISDIKVQGDRFIFQSEILFASGRAEINESGKKELDKFAGIYKEMIPKIPTGVDLIILIQGHTDIDPVRSAKYRTNWELSSDRAMQVVRYLIEKGIPATRLGAAALGEFHPVEKGDSPDAKRLNRRIEIKITSL
ncbi:MAG: OmpA family protein [Desulfomonile tiedjei]|nr:OmpA family protein [Desulfomonile tiedjei]